MDNSLYIETEPCPVPTSATKRQVPGSPFIDILFL